MRINIYVKKNNRPGLESEDKIMKKKNKKSELFLEQDGIILKRTLVLNTDL